MAAIVKKPSPQQTDDFKCRPTWEASAYRGKNNLFAEDEWFLVAEGEAILHCDDVGSVRCAKGDLVLIQKGTVVVWEVPVYIKKHYLF